MYIEKQLELVADALAEKVLYRHSNEAETTLSNYPALYTLLYEDIDEWEDDLEDYAHKLDQELRNINCTLLSPLEHRWMHQKHIFIPNGKISSQRLSYYW